MLLQFQPLLIAMTALCFITTADAAEIANLLKNGDFTDGPRSWSDFGVSEAKETTVVEIDGRKVARLERKQDKAPVSIAQGPLKLKPQTLYRLQATGWGTAQANLRIRLASSKDPQFSNLLKIWATSTAPFPAGDNPQTTSLTFDTGLKIDNANSVSVYLSEGPAGGIFHVTDISLVELGPSAPAKDEAIILHLGDSFTITSYLPFEQRIERLLQPALEAKFPGRKIRQINYGADGEHVKDLLDSGRYKSIIKEHLPRVDVVIIRYGANDQPRSTPAEFRQRLTTLCDTLQADYPTIKIVLATGTSVKGNKAINDKYAPFWQAIRDVAADRKYPLADIVKRFEQENTADLQKGPADMHPSPKGVQVTADEELKILQELLAR